MELSISKSSTKIIENTINIEIEKHQKAIEYNEYLINNNIDYTLLEYLKDANEKFYKYDIDFMEDFMELVDKVDFCISHEYLNKYEVIKSKNSNDIFQMLKSRGLKKEVDYIVREETHHRKKRK